MNNTANLKKTVAQDLGISCPCNFGVVTTTTSSVLAKFEILIIGATNIVCQKNEGNP